MQADCADVVNNRCTATPTHTYTHTPQLNWAPWVFVFPVNVNTALYRNPYAASMHWNVIYWHCDAQKYTPIYFYVQYVIFVACWLVSVLFSLSYHNTNIILTLLIQHVLHKLKETPFWTHIWRHAWKCAWNSVIWKWECRVCEKLSFDCYPAAVQRDTVSYFKINYIVAELEQDSS